MIGRMNTDLTGRVAIITGAASPTGAAVARTLAAAGARVALADLNPDRIAALAAEIRAAGGEAIDIAADVASKFQCVTIVETTRAEWGRLDILVNATIVRPSVSLIKMDEWEWARCLDVNLKGTFLMCQLVGRVMADESGGTILILAEGADDVPGAPQNAAHAASMAGMTGFAAACAAEYRPLGIEVRLVGRDELEGAFR
jgi:NAD(P)-dependent dehydrogenase (short-subunit alcohol dehydrogenase family)